MKRKGEDEAPREEQRQTKECPRCGALTFADMDVCFGCLYEYDGSEGLAQELLGAFANDEDSCLEGEARPLEVFPELYEPAEAHHLVEPSANFAVERASPERKAPKGNVVRAVRDAQVPVMGLHLAHPNRLGVELRHGDLCLRCQVPQEGLAIGRDEGNDIIIRSPNVSRKHVRIVPTKAGLIVEDRGATNQAKVDGMPVRTQAKLGLSSSLDVCGTKFTAVCLSV